jgi:hypothetical protein
MERLSLTRDGQARSSMVIYSVNIRPRTPTRRRTQSVSLPGRNLRCSYRSRCTEHGTLRRR